MVFAPPSVANGFVWSNRILRKYQMENASCNLLKRISCDSKACGCPFWFYYHCCKTNSFSFAHESAIAFEFNFFSNRKYKINMSFSILFGECFINWMKYHFFELISCIFVHFNDFSYNIFRIYPFVKHWIKIVLKLCKITESSDSHTYMCQYTMYT